MDPFPQLLLLLPILLLIMSLLLLELFLSLLHTNKIALDLSLSYLVNLVNRLDKLLDKHSC